MVAIEDLSFEEAVAALDEVVSKLEGEELPLDEAVAHYERGRALAAHCQELLDTVSLRVEQLGAGSESGDAVVPFDQAAPE